MKFTEMRQESHEERAAKAPDETLQVLADKLHKLTCNMDHTERCAYHYGNWQTDIRSEMLHAYKTVEIFSQKFGAKGVVQRLDAIEAGDRAKEELYQYDPKNP